jgi:ATP-dependent DNA helicase RecQ
MDFIRNPRAIQLVQERDFSDADARDAMAAARSSEGGAADPRLRGMLKDLRKEVADEEGLPPYVIFQDVSLDEMATHYPICEDELLRITGVGTGKAKKFGAPFLELIQNYVEVEGIERPDDLLVRSSAHRSTHKVSIIQRIDRKIPLADIAVELHLPMAELLSEMESISTSGTRLNLDYAIDEVMDEENIEELFDHFRSSDEEGIEGAVAEYGDVYSEEEIRLARLKFLSDYAN